MSFLKKIILLFFVFCYLNSSSQWVKIYTHSGYQAYDLAFVNDSIGVLGTYQSMTPASKTLVMMRTSNFGINWTATPLYTQGNPPSLGRLNGDTITILSSDSWYTGSFNISPNGGQTYQTVNLNTNAYQYHYKNITYGIYSQWGGVLKRGYSTVGTFSTSGIQDLWLNSYKDFFVVSGNKLYATNDTGATWNIVASPTVTMTKMTFTSYSVGYITCTNGSVMKSIDAGMTWTVINTGVSQNLNGLSFKNDNLGYVVGNNGTVLKTINGGVSWIPEAFPGTQNLSIIKVLNKKAYILSNNELFKRDVDTCAAPPSTSLILSEDTVCMTSAFGSTITLSGTPVGGTFSGPMGTTTNTVFTPNYLPGNYDLAYTYQDTKGCFGVSQATLMIRNCVGVNEQIDENESFVLYPNPTIGIINLNSTSENVRISLFNYLGEELLTKTLSENENSLNLTLYPSGIYFIRVYLKQNYIRTFKVVKE